MQDVQDHLEQKEIKEKKVKMSMNHIYFNNFNSKVSFSCIMKVTLEVVVQIADQDSKETKVNVDSMESQELWVS